MSRFLKAKLKTEEKHDYKNLKDFSFHVDEVKKTKKRSKITTMDKSAKN